MTFEEFKQLNLPIPDSSQLYVESGLEWIRDNTLLPIDMNDFESIKALPSSARLFLVKFCEICEKDLTVSSDSVGPMSQSFKSESVSNQTDALARQLLKPYLKSGVKFIPCPKRWHS